MYQTVSTKVSRKSPFANKLKVLTCHSDSESCMQQVNETNTISQFHILMFWILDFEYILIIQFSLLVVLYVCRFRKRKIKLHKSFAKKNSLYVLRFSRCRRATMQDDQSVLRDTYLKLMIEGENMLYCLICEQILQLSQIRSTCWI